MTGTKVIHDDATFDPIAYEFVIRYVEAIARLLHREELVEFDLNVYDNTMSDLLFALCFLGIAEFEERSGIAAGDDKYRPRGVFEQIKGATGQTFLIGDTQLHGLVDDDTMHSGVKRALASVKRSGNRRPEMEVELTGRQEARRKGTLK